MSIGLDSKPGSTHRNSGLKNSQHEEAFKFENPEQFANEILKGVTNAVIANQDPEYLYKITDQNCELAEASKEVIVQGIEKIRKTIMMYEE